MLKFKVSLSELHDVCWKNYYEGSWSSGCQTLLNSGSEAQCAAWSYNLLVWLRNFKSRGRLWILTKLLHDVANFVRFCIKDVEFRFSDGEEERFESRLGS